MFARAARSRTSCGVAETTLPESGGITLDAEVVNVKVMALLCERYERHAPPFRISQSQRFIAMT